jgi:hypothetical protein
MKTYRARVVEIVHEEQNVTFEVADDSTDDDIDAAAITAAEESTEKPKLIGVMDRVVNDIQEVK